MAAEEMLVMRMAPKRRHTWVVIEFDYWYAHDAYMHGCCNAYGDDDDACVHECWDGCGGTIVDDCLMFIAAVPRTPPSTNLLVHFLSGVVESTDRLATETSHLAKYYHKVNV